MALSKLASLYMALVTEHSKSPHNRGVLEGLEPTCLHNPSCGDVIQLFVDCQEDRVEAISFTGEGCSISTASASMMTDCVKGKSRAEVEDLLARFSDLVQGKDVPDQDSLGDAAFLAGVAKFPQRIKCATLAWNALKQALSDAASSQATDHL